MATCAPWAGRALRRRGADVARAPATQPRARGKFRRRSRTLLSTQRAARSLRERGARRPLLHTGAADDAKFEKGRRARAIGPIAVARRRRRRVARRARPGGGQPAATFSIAPRLPETRGDVARCARRELAVSSQPRSRRSAALRRAPPILATAAQREHVTAPVVPDAHPTARSTLGAARDGGQGRSLVENAAIELLSGRRVLPAVGLSGIVRVWRSRGAAAPPVGLLPREPTAIKLLDLSSPADATSRQTRVALTPDTPVSCLGHP